MLRAPEEPAPGLELGRVAKPHAAAILQAVSCGARRFDDFAGEGSPAARHRSPASYGDDRGIIRREPIAILALFVGVAIFAWLSERMSQIRPNVPIPRRRKRRAGPLSPPKTMGWVQDRADSTRELSSRTGGGRQYRDRRQCDHAGVFPILRAGHQAARQARRSSRGRSTTVRDSND